MKHKSSSWKGLLFVIIEIFHFPLLLWTMCILFSYHQSSISFCSMEGSPGFLTNVEVSSRTPPLALLSISQLARTLLPSILKPLDISHQTEWSARCSHKNSPREGRSIAPPLSPTLPSKACVGPLSLTDPKPAGPGSLVALHLHHLCSRIDGDRGMDGAAPMARVYAAI